MKSRLLFKIFVLLLILILGNGFSCAKTSPSKVDQIMNADRDFQFPPGFPPDPGEPGKETLEGIDADHDGLRDDLQRWIYARFPNDPKKRGALRQLAIAYQGGLFLKHDVKELNAYSDRVGKASCCLFETFSDFSQASLEGEYVHAKVLNTRIRTEHHLEIDPWFDGMVVEAYPRNGTACEN